MGLSPVTAVTTVGGESPSLGAIARSYRPSKPSIQPSRRPPGDQRGSPTVRDRAIMAGLTRRFVATAAACQKRAPQAATGAARRARRELAATANQWGPPPRRRLKGSAEQSRANLVRKGPCLHAGWLMA